MARIAIGGFQHETNCFVPQATDFDYFAAHRDRPPLCRGADVLDWLTGISFGMSGFLEEMAADHELTPLLWTSGGAGGIVTREAYERIAGELVGGLSLAMPVDAVYLDLHGAMVTEDFEDGEGELLRRVRAVVGPDIPVVISLDYHVNLTQAMVEHCDGMAIYLTYPHIDRAETGQRAARILSTVLERGQPPVRKFVKLPFLIPLNFQCTMVPPSADIVAASVEGEGGDVLNLSYGAGFPPSDLAECGPGVVAHGYDRDAVDAAVAALVAEIEAREAEFSEPLLSPDGAVAEANAISARASRPVVLADTQDNPGCGGTGDTTGLLKALVDGNAQGAVLGVMADPEAAAIAHEAGEGAEISIALGGKSGPEGVEPFEGTFRVERLGDGKFTCTGPCVRGRTVDIGPTALLVIDGVSVVVASKRMQAYDQDIFRHLGVEPSEQKILALKSTCHFRADFEPIAEKVLIAIAPGGHIADSKQYPYRNLRKGVRLEPLGPEFDSWWKNAP
jgi:microcystin degradation protein MlrC